MRMPLENIQFVSLFPDQTQNEGAGPQFPVVMALCNTAVPQLLMHWRYCSLALSHQFHGGTSVKYKYIFLIIEEKNGSASGLDINSLKLNDTYMRL